jgi:hypothetical protein
MPLEMTMATRESSLDEQVETVQSREDLAGFVRDLVNDLRTRPGEWENDRLDTYLEAVAAWIEDMDGYYQNRGEAAPQEPSWKLLGEILLAAKSYE